jgi:hypothetical protein
MYSGPRRSEARMIQIVGGETEFCVDPDQSLLSI